MLIYMVLDILWIYYVRRERELRREGRGETEKEILNHIINYYIYGENYADL